MSRSARTRLALGPVVACLSFALVLTCPPAARADAVDGRADWRPPDRSAPTTAPPASGRRIEPVREPDNAPPVLGRIDAQTLVAGRPWQLHVRVRDPDGDRPRLRVRGLPTGGRVESGRAGWFVLEWTPPANMVRRIELTLVAVDARDAALRSERTVQLEVAMPAPSEPLIGPFATQIVSAGRTVAYAVKASLENGDLPLLQIDRLPRNASFDQRADGTRVFYWPTTDADQGEHRFRVTALDPDDPDVASGAELLVIIGDPTRSSTAPGDETSFEDPPPGAPAALTLQTLDERLAPDEGYDPSVDEPFLPSGEVPEPDVEASYGDDTALSDEDADPSGGAPLPADPAFEFGGGDSYFEEGQGEFDPESGTFVDDSADGTFAPPSAEADYFSDDGQGSSSE